MIQPTDYLEPAAPQAAPDFIEMRGISKRFGGVRALSDVGFSIRAAEIHCLAGENGCGKSTLIKILSGVHAPDEGQIILEGQAHSHLSPAASQRFGVQIIYQDLSLFPNLSVAENITFGHQVQTPVSVDGTADALDAVKQGQLAGTVAQYPDTMAYMAVEALVKKLNGETVPEKIDSPIKLITKDNVSEAGKYYKDELDLSSNR
jgi:ABC-type sugar transport system ATPase subunit